MRARLRERVTPNLNRSLSLQASSLILSRVFPVDEESAALPPPRRACPDCRIEMDVRHRGVFVTLYTCPACGVNITIPKPFPALKSDQR
jgi:hypothetical protein